MKNSSQLFFLPVNDYIERLRLDLKSDKTITTYIEGLESFRKYLSTIGDIEKIRFCDVDDEVIREFLKNLIDSGISLSTRNIKLVAIKGYIRFCAEKDITLLPLQLKVSRIKTKKVPAKKHNWISATQVRLLLEQPSRNKTGIRDRFIIMLLFSTGMRLAELLSCRIGSVHLCGDDSYIHVTGKGSKPRVVPITQETIDNITAYMTVFHRTPKKEDYLVYTIHDGAMHMMSADNVQRIVKKYAAMAKLMDEDFPNLHPHMLRHSYGAILYRNNMSKAEIAKLLGHEQESTTEIYVETDVDMIRKSLKKVYKEDEIDLYLTLSNEDKKKLKMVNH
jgi:site-specific recombinase XerD